MTPHKAWHLKTSRKSKVWCCNLFVLVPIMLIVRLSSIYPNLVAAFIQVGQHTLCFMYESDFDGMRNLAVTNKV